MPRRSTQAIHFEIAFGVLLSEECLQLGAKRFAEVGRRTFGVIDAATQGGPSKATEVLVFKVFHDGFKGQDFGGAAAQSVILMTIVIALTVVQFRYVERKVNY